MTTMPKPPSSATSLGAGSVVGGPFKSEAHRRPPEPATVAPRRQSTSESNSDDARRMFIGRDISMSGEISSCDVLLVEGSVEARLRESRHLEVTETGSFKGDAEVDEADISGRFEGELIVHGRLKVRASGRIEGRLQYGELEVESGGQLIGDIHVAQSASTPAAPARAVVPPEPARLAGFPSVPPASAASRGVSGDTTSAVAVS